MRPELVRVCCGTWRAPNWSVKRTPTLSMASPFSWPVLVPSALPGSGAAYLGR
jgi:hypothetical protein